MSCRLLPGVYRRLPFVWSLGLLALLLLPVSLQAQDAVDPQTITLEAIDRLRFVQEIEPEAAPEIEVVIEHLARTVQGMDGTSLLPDNCHLVSAPQGLAAWIEVRQAVLQLQQLLDQANRKNPRIPLSLAVQGLLTDVRDDLVHAYRFLAAVAVQEAQAFTDEASAATQADLAARRLADAEEQIAAGEIVRGLQSLRQAWEHAQLAIEVDLTADSPLINLETPTDGATVFSSRVDVAGMVQLLTLGTVGADDVVVTVNGQTAEVVQRSFLARDIPLREGLNAVVAVARSSEGGVGTACAAVRFDPSDRPQIVAAGGTDQAATISTLLPEPLTVRVSDDSGNPLAGEQVIFRVVQGDGTLAGGVRGSVVETDADGIASTGFTLGSRAGVAVHRVRATAVGIEGDVVFSPTALTSDADRIHAVSGDNQRGLVGEPLALPLVAVVTDEGQNLVAGAPVTFEVVGGGGSVDGEPQTEVATDSDGRAAVTFRLGPEPGLDAHRVRATFPGLAREPVTFKASGFVAGDPADTRILGVVLDGQGDPVPGVTLSVEGADGAVRADADGQFVLTGVPVGEVNLEMDGSTATRPGIWSSLSFHLHTLPGVDNRLPKPIFTLPLDVGRGKVVGGPEDVTVEIPEVPGFSLTVLAGSATFSDGSSTGVVSVTPVHADKIPMSPGSGMQPRFIVTVQPEGVHFDPPAPVTYPNVDGLPAGAVTEMFSFDHDLGEFVSIGTGTVSEDGTVLRSDPGFGIVKAGWHCAAPQSESGAGSSLQVEIKTAPPVVLVVGGTPPSQKQIETEGEPLRDSVYEWTIDDGPIATLNAASLSNSSTTSIATLSPTSCSSTTTCDTTATAGQKGKATATVTIECTTTGETAEDSIEVVVTEVKLKEVTYSGTGFHEVSEDGGGTYSAPHWQDNSSPLDGDAEDPSDRRYPVSYVRGSPLTVSAKFQVAPPVDFPDPVKVRATGPSGLDIPETVASSGGGEIRISGVSTNSSLPDAIRFFDPLMLQWEISVDDGASWTEVGSSDNRVYVTLSAPITNKPLFETLLDVGCRNADGVNDTDDAVTAIWSDFSGPIPGVIRKVLDGHNVSDGAEMHYWVDTADPRLPDVGQFCQLLEAMLDPIPSNPKLANIGTCAAWSNFFHETVRAQGINGTQIIEVKSGYPGPGSAFLVNNWSFAATGSAPGSCAPFTHLGSEATDQAGAPGQGTGNPPGGFFNHFIVRYAGQYYDPSYGAGPFGGASDTEATNAWENASLAGFLQSCSGQGVVKPNDPSTVEVVFIPR